MSHEQTAHYMRQKADSVNENDVSSWLNSVLKEIKDRAEQGYYSAEVQFPAEANDRNSLVAHLHRRGYNVTDINTYVYTAQVSWS